MAKRGRPKGKTNDDYKNERAAEGLDEYGLPLEPLPSGEVGKRIRPQHQDEVRAKIQSAHLIRRLQLNALGQLSKEMSAGQIKSAEVLLSKSLSTLSATEVVSVNNNDRMSEAEINGKIAELLAKDPALLSIVAAMTGGGGRIIEHEPPCIVCGGAGLPGGCGVCGAASIG